jgi:hypothetical protein
MITRTEMKDIMDNSIMSCSFSVNVCLGIVIHEKYSKVSEGKDFRECEK